MRLCFRRLGEEGEEDRLRFFGMGEPAAEAAGITDAAPCAVSRSAGRALCVGDGASYTSAEDPAFLLFDRP